MEESELSPRQRKWLEASRKIGPGAMTKSERQLLEKLYAEMLPTEQQELLAYIREKFNEKDSSAGQDEDPIARMEGKAWREPSEALKKAFSKVRSPRTKTKDKDD